MIRPENTSDVASIRKILLAGFPNAAEANLVESLRAAGRLSISLVAEVDGSVVGHIAFSPVTVDEQPPTIQGSGLAPLAVDAAYHRRGIGGTLIRAGIDACRQRGDAFVVVLGDPAYYGRFGFRTASEFGLGNEYGVDEPFMVLQLEPGALSGCHGTVRYCAEFAALG